MGYPIKDWMKIPCISVPLAEILYKYADADHSKLVPIGKAY
jgi:hypothetical protein